MNAATVTCLEQTADAPAPCTSPSVNRLANLLAILRREQQALQGHCTLYVADAAPGSQSPPSEAKE
jgi:hypothetical protein